mgnify:CR=1 FL=1
MVHIRTLMDEMIRIDEGRMKDIFTANQEGESAEEIAKRLKLPIKTVKSILGEEGEDIVEFTDSQLDVLARQYQSLAGKTISIDQANKLRKIFKGVPDRSLDALRKKKIPFLSGLALSRMVQKGMPVKEELDEAPDPTQYGPDKVAKAMAIAVKSDGNYSQAVREIEKIGRGLSKVSTIARALKTANEQLSMKATFRNGDDKTFKGKTASDINKQVKEYEKKNNTGLQHDGPMIKEKKSAFRLSYSDRYGKHAGFEDADTLADLQNKAANLRKKGFKIDKMGRNTSPIKDENIKEARYRVSGTMTYRGISGNDGFEMVINARNEEDAEDKAYKELDKARDRKKIGPGGGGSIEDVDIEGVEKTNDRLDPPSHFRVSEFDPSVKESNLDVDNVDKKDSSKEKELKIKLDKEKDQDALEKQLVAAQGQINLLKSKLENEKNRAIKPEPNPETGEVPLTVGIAHKLIKDKQDKEMKKEEVDNYPTSDINKKKHAAYKDPKSGERKPVHTHEGARLVYETIKGLKNKADKTGMPYSILKKVYDRGMAAWRGGHRPGTSQQQWAFARVNSFVTKSSGTWGGADKDLAKQVRGSKK